MRKVQSETGRSRSGIVVSLAFVASMSLAFMFALAVDHGYLGERVGTLLCVGAQQLAFADAVFRIRSMSNRVNGARSTTSLIVICLMAMYFSLVVPSLFTQIHTGRVVPNEPANLIFSVPVVLLAVVMLIRARRYRG